MYVSHVNGLVIEYSDVKNASTRDNIYGKVVKIIDEASGAREPVGKSNSGDDSSDPKDVIKPKNMA